MQQGWETSAREASGEFISALNSGDFGFGSGVPVDPVNNAIEDTITETRANLTYGYYYVRYGAGSYGCDINRGNFYVLALAVTGTTGVARHPDSPGFSCSGRNWGNEFPWATGGFTN